MIDRLLKKLHRVFEKDPSPIDAITIEENGEALITGGKLTVTPDGGNTTQYSLDGMTIAEIASALQADGIACEVADSSTADMLAIGLMSIRTETPAALRYPTNLLYQELKVYAMLLEQQFERIGLASKQIYLHSASDEWIEYWCRQFLAHPRIRGESDDEYLRRTIAEIIRPNQNNIAIEKLIEDAIGLNTTVVDALSIFDELSAEQQAIANGRFLLSIDVPAGMEPDVADRMISTARAIARRHKSAGTELFYEPVRKSNIHTDTVTAEDVCAAHIEVTVVDALTKGPVQYGGGLVYGTPGLVYGDNEPIIESVKITIENIETGETRIVVAGD